MAAHEPLLRRYKPALLYDSQETYFADSAAEWTDNAGNTLCRKTGQVIAAQPTLTLDYLRAGTYPNGDPVQESDLISDPARDYRNQYARLRSSDRARYANRVYGRGVDGSDGRIWLQYWFWYFYNDYTLAFDIGLHEGDWEMVQLRLDHGTPDLAVYAQHASAEVAQWADVKHPAGQPDTPLVFPGRGSHASYFEPGLHETEVWYDLADGKRSAPELELEFFDDLRWAEWPGSWGDTPKRNPLEDASPVAPCRHRQWRDPGWLLKNARDHAKVEPGPAPEVDVSRWRDHLHLRYDLKSHPGDPPFGLVVTVNSRNEPAVAPHAHTYRLRDRGPGEIDDPAVPLDPRKRYDVYVSTTDSAGVPSASAGAVIPPLRGRSFDPRSILRAIGRAVAALRRRLGRA